MLIAKQRTQHSCALCSCFGICLLLKTEHSGVFPVVLHKLGMRSVLHYFSVFKQRDFIGYR